MSGNPNNKLFQEGFFWGGRTGLTDGESKPLSRLNQFDSGLSESIKRRSKVQAFLNVFFIGEECKNIKITDSEMNKYLSLFSALSSI